MTSISDYSPSTVDWHRLVPGHSRALLSLDDQVSLLRQQVEFSRLAAELDGHAPAAVAGSTSAAISTDDLVARAQVAHVRANLSQGTIDTRLKRWKQFAREFRVLPEAREELLSYLDRFNDSPRYRNAQLDSLRALYRVAVDDGLLPVSPLDGVRDSRVPERPVLSLSLEQAAVVGALPMSSRQRIVWHLLAGHGWRQIEVVRLRVGDVREAKKGWIWCRGKMRSELAPILDETLDLLRDAVPADAADDAAVLRNRRGDPASDDAIHRDAMHLIESAGLHVNAHALRKTFATIVAESASDEVLAMRLLRDRIPGMASTYIARDLPAMLAQFSPLRQVCGVLPATAGELTPAAGESSLSAGEDVAGVRGSRTHPGLGS